MSIKILFVEDDLLFAESIVDLLEDSGYSVTHSPNADDALELIYSSRFELYLFDINLPITSGLELLRLLRDASDVTPAIFLTSHSDNRVLADAFDIGADDYVKKPFDTIELLCRIKSKIKKSTINVANITLDEVHRCVSVDDKRLHLSIKEYQLLVLMIKHIDQTVTKEMIIDELWSPSESVSDGAIRVYINRIKSECNKLKIENIRGVGYRLVS